MITIHKALQWGTLQLHQTSDSSRLDALILLSYILNVTRTHLISYSEHELSQQNYLQFKTYIRRRAQQEPIPYITGQCEFWSLNFKVNKNCLIPRPETEILVEQVLATPLVCPSQTVLELGTGSGIIAIVLALEKPLWSITATDLSEAALKVAKQNALQLEATIDYRAGSWFEAIPKTMTFHHIISNPPYLAANDKHLKSSLRYEPKQSLVSGDTGLEDLHQLIRQARSYLVPKGFLWLEQGYNQALSVKEMMLKYGYTDIQQYKDLSGILRVSRGCYL